MANFERYQRSESVNAGRVSTGKSQMLQSLSDRLQQFANKEQVELQRKNAFEGDREGRDAAAGKIGGIEMQNNDTIRGRAFNKGAMMSHAAQIQIDVRESVAEHARANPYDVAGFDSNVDGFSKGLMSEIDPSMKALAESEINDYASRARIGIQDNVYKQNMDYTTSVLTKVTSGMTEDILNFARAFDSDMVEKKREQLEAIYADGIEAGALDSKSVDANLISIDEQIDKSLMEGYFDNLFEQGDPEKVQTELNKFINAEDKKLEKNISILPGTRDDIISKVQGKINKINTANKTAFAVKTKQAKTYLDDFNSVIDQGFLPDEEVLKFAIENSKGTEHFDDLIAVESFARMYTPFISMTIEDQANELALQKSKKNMFAADVKNVERLEKIHNDTIEEAKTNGLELYFKQGIINTPQPELDFDLLGSLKWHEGKQVEKSPEDKAADRVKLAQQFAQNVALAEQASAHYGVKVPPITQTQAKALKHAIKEGNREEVIGMMSVITNGFGIDTPDAMAAVFGGDTTAYAAIGGQIVTKTPHSMDVATDMLKGIDKMKDFPTLIAKDFDIKISEIIGQTYENFPDHRKVIVNGAKALYAQYLIEDGVYGGTGESYVTDEAILEKALKDSTGGYADMEAQGTNLFDDDNYRIELPRDSKGSVQSADQVEDWMNNLTAADIDTMGGVKDMESAEVVRIINLGYVKLVSLGDGLYAVSTGREAEAVMLDPETSEPFELDYSIGRHYDSTLGFSHETGASEIENESKYVEEETTLTDVIDSVGDTVLDVANAITDATVGNLADLIYDEETMDKVKASKDRSKQKRKEKRYDKKQNGKKAK